MSFHLRIPALRLYSYKPSSALVEVLALEAAEITNGLL